jgi:hypothetical protein
LEFCDFLFVGDFAMDMRDKWDRVLLLLFVLAVLIKFLVYLIAWEPEMPKKKGPVIPQEDRALDLTA